jgi:hypothetical protein
MTPANLDAAALMLLFPNLKAGTFRDTSPPADHYNCIAWVAGDDQKWWEPADLPGYYWPPGIPQEYQLEDAVAVFAGLGFVACSSAELESDFEKVAIYGDGVEYTHAARQLASGHWTSKLGAHQDIEHASPECLIGREFGQVACIMKRPWSTGAT